MINSRGEVSPRALPGWDGYQRHLLEEEGVTFDAAGRVDLNRFLWDPTPGPPAAVRLGRPLVLSAQDKTF